jgi:hypothetical protein
MIDGMNGEVCVVDRASKGRSRASAGRDGRLASSPRSTVAVDRQGNIYTSEVQTGQRLQKFRRIDMQN